MKKKKRRPLKKIREIKNNHFVKEIVNKTDDKIKNKNSNGRTLAILGIVIPIIATCLFWYWDNKVELDGGILYIVKSEIFTHNETNKVDWYQKNTAFQMYIHLINNSKKSIFLKNYIIEMDHGQGFESLERYSYIDDYMRDNESKQPLKFKDGTFFDKNFLNNQAVIEPGKDIKGWATMFGDISYNKIHTLRYKITCVDIKDNRYELINDQRDGKNIITPGEIEQISGVKLDSIPVWVFPDEK